MRREVQGLYERQRIESTGTVHLPARVWSRPTFSKGLDFELSPSTAYMFHATARSSTVCKQVSGADMCPSIRPRRRTSAIARGTKRARG